MSLSPTPLLYNLLRSLQQEGADRLSTYLQQQRWFRSKARHVVQLEVVDLAPVMDHPLLVLVVVRCVYEQSDSETYLLPLLVHPTDASATDTILTIDYAGRSEQVREAIHDSNAMLQIAGGIRSGREWAGAIGTFRCLPTSVASNVSWPAQAAPLGGDQSNSCILLGQSLVLKFLRKLEPGIHPDVEVLSFLTSRAYAEVPRLIGSIEYRSSTSSATTAMLQEFVPNQGDAWSYVLKELRRLREAVPAGQVRQIVLAKPREFVLEQTADLLSQLRELGETTSHLHLTLASQSEGEPFGPDRIHPEDIAAWRQTMEARLDAVFRLVERPMVCESLGLSRTSAVALQQACRHRLAGLAVLAQPGMLKIRQHGDYHLGQILKRADGRGFVILDFEGEPARPLSERRAKISVFKDLAGMLRSFSYAAEALWQEGSRPTEVEVAVVSAWKQLAAEAFLTGYEPIVRRGLAGLLPPPDEMEAVLCAFEVDKAAYELGYELNNRPAWVKIPLQALQALCSLPQGP